MISGYPLLVFFVIWLEKRRSTAYYSLEIENDEATRRGKVDSEVAMTYRSLWLGGSHFTFRNSHNNVVFYTPPRLPPWYRSFDSNLVKIGFSKEQIYAISSIPERRFLWCDARMCLYEFSNFIDVLLVLWSFLLPQPRIMKISFKFQINCIHLLSGETNSG